MGILGPNSGGTFVSDSSIGSIAISNPANAIMSDNSYATSVLLLGQITNYLKATNFNFSIPNDATIDGVLVEIERSTTVLTSISDNSIKLVKSNIISGNDLSSGAIWPTSDAYTSFGSSTNTWGISLTPNDINDSGFGVVISASASIAAIAQIDHIRITIYYTGSNQAPMGNFIKVGDGLSKSD